MSSLVYSPSLAVYCPDGPRSDFIGRETMDRDGNRIIYNPPAIAALRSESLELQKVGKAHRLKVAEVLHNAALIHQEGHELHAPQRSHFTDALRSTVETLLKQAFALGYHAVSVHARYACAASFRRKDQNHSHIVISSNQDAPREVFQESKYRNCAEKSVMACAAVHHFGDPELLLLYRHRRPPKPKVQQKNYEVRRLLPCSECNQHRVARLYKNRGTLVSVATIENLEHANNTGFLRVPDIKLPIYYLGKFIDLDGREQELGYVEITYQAMNLPSGGSKNPKYYGLRVDKPGVSVAGKK